MLLYAALELRFGIEARLHEFREANKETVRLKKGEWRIAAIGQGLEKAFSIGERLAAVTVPVAGRPKTFFYTPVTRDLRELGGRLGDFLHNDPSKTNDDVRWERIRAQISRGIELLTIACSGEMLGPMLIHRKTMQAKVSLSLDPRNPNSRFTEIDMPAKGVVHVVDVQYPSELPSHVDWVRRILANVEPT